MRSLPPADSGTLRPAMGAEWERRDPCQALFDVAVGRGSLHQQGAEVEKRSELAALLPHALSSHRGGQGSNPHEFLQIGGL
jgi:hypothetical protein